MWRKPRRGEGTIQNRVLIEQIRAGDQLAVSKLIEQYHEYIYRTVYAVLRNEKDAEDAAQETFVKIYYALPRYEGKGLKTWMTRIAVNHAIDMKRKLLRRREKVIQLNDYEQIPSTEPNISVPLLRAEQRDKVQQRLKELPDNYQEVIRAYYIEEKSYRQIAKEQQLEVKTIETKLYRARNWIRKHWKEDDF